LLIVYFFRNFGKDDANTDYYILTNQISKMNKMVVLEQDFSSMQKTKITSKLLGIRRFAFISKRIVILPKQKRKFLMI
jgi:hypothetical protein